MSLRKQEIEDRLNAWIVFNEKNKELCSWLVQMESKVLQTADVSIEDMIDKLQKVSSNATFLQLQSGNSLQRHHSSCIPGFLEVIHDVKPAQRGFCEMSFSIISSSCVQIWSLKQSRNATGLHLVSVSCGGGSGLLGFGVLGHTCTPSTAQSGVLGQLTPSSTQLVSRGQRKD